MAQNALQAKLYAMKSASTVQPPLGITVNTQSYAIASQKKLLTCSRENYDHL